MRPLVAIGWAVALISVALAASGCGSSGGGSTTAEDPAAARTSWANELCGALVTWRSDLTSLKSELTNGQSLSKSGLQSSAGKAEDATTTLASSLKGLGKPPTPAADEAKSAVDNLANELSDGVDTLKSEVSNVSGAQGVLSAISSASATVSTMAKEVTSTVTHLQSLGAQGEWRTAFSQAESCKTLKGS